MITVNGQKLNIDILGELEQFQWKKAQIRGEKFIACSPLREDERPSFAVHLESGVYIDSAHTSDYWKKGNFQKLLSFLLSEPLEKIEAYLLEKYSPLSSNTDNLKLTLNLSLNKEPKHRVIEEKLLDRYKHPNYYLTHVRGIRQAVLDAYDVGFDSERNLSTFVWRERDGEPINVKFRKNNEKSFFYLPQADGIKKHLYLYHDVYKKKAKTCYITESEIDALYIRNLGEDFNAIALGGAHLSKQQEKLLLSSPVQKFILATDNDEPGKLIAEYITAQLLGYKQIEKIRIPERYKDVNDVPLEELSNVLKSTEFPKFSFLA